MSDKILKVVMAEDSPVQGVVLKRILTEQNFEVWWGKNGQLAYDLVLEHKPDILITDAEMPVMDGFKLCQTIKNNEDTQLLPVLLCTSLSSPEDVMRGMEVGADGYVTKPYDKTFLIKPIDKRQHTKTFLAPNRIIAGERKHRLEMLYHIFKLGMTDNYISCPAVCPVENISIAEAAQPLLAQYPDIQDVFAAQQLPIMFEGETDHPMHSCWLSLFDQAADSMLYLVTETVANGRRHHITEKTFKPIAMGMPFVLVATQGSLKYLRSYGFKTFGSFWDESYDDIKDDNERIAAVARTLKQLEDLGPEYRNAIFHSASDIVKHNWNHFYNGGFEQILWAELQAMLNGTEL
jgi:CheY-like chemotaxis protein